MVDAINFLVKMRYFPACISMLPLTSPQFTSNHIVVKYSFFLSFFFKDLFIYERERERERKAEAEAEAGSSQRREPNA